MDSEDVRFYLSVFLRRLHYFLIPAVLITAAGIAAALLLPPVYLAAARILVESPRISADPTRPSLQTDAIQQLQVLEQQLTTRASLLAMAAKFGIYAADGMSADEIVTDMRARTRVEPIASPNLGGTNNAIAFAVSFEAQDANLAADMANAYATAILDANARERNEKAAAAHEFFRDEVEHLQAALNEAQDAILGFKREHKEALPDSLEFRRMQQTNLQERLRELQREQASLQQRRTAIEQIVADPAGAPRARNSDDQTLMDLRRALAEQEGIFSGDSPNLRMLRSRIAELEKRRSSAAADDEQLSQRSDLSPDLRVQVADIEGQLTFIEEEQASIRRTLVDVARSIADTEMNATRLSALERTYDNAQTQYNAAVSRLAEASRGQRIEVEAVGQKLSLIEPATAPSKPIWPRRHIIAAGGLAAGIGIGFGLVLVLEFWNPSIRRPSDLALVFEGQPFATIPYISNGQEARVRRVAVAALILVLLGGITGFMIMRKHLPPPLGTAVAEVSNEAGKLHWA